MEVVDRVEGDQAGTDLGSNRRWALDETDEEEDPSYGVEGRGTDKLTGEDIEAEMV